MSIVQNMHQFEIEIKSLLGSKEKADELVTKLKQQDPNLQILGAHKQLNHYFVPTPSGTGLVGGDLKTLFDKIQSLLDDSLREKLKDLSLRAKDFSVRTREADGKVILVVKASVDDTTSENGTARLEFEAVLFPSPGDGEGLREKSVKSISDLDKLLLDSGFKYQAKWSRERQDFIFRPKGRQISVSMDKNAGYGYLSEFEVVVNDESKAEEVKAFIRETMENLGIVELNQDRLARMFDFYNKNWREYYGTDKIFMIE